MSAMRAVVVRADADAGMQEGTHANGSNGPEGVISQCRRGSSVAGGAWRGGPLRC